VLEPVHLLGFPRKRMHSLPDLHGILSFWPGGRAATANTLTVEKLIAFSQAGRIVVEEKVLGMVMLE
jgi:hypothetical protein